MDRVPRRLAAILVADVSGYSRLMEQDEAGTLNVLRAQRREVIFPSFAKIRRPTRKNHGRQAATLAQLGRMDQAQHEAENFMADHPKFTIGHWVASQPAHDKAVVDHFVDGFRKVGVPQ